MVEPKYYHYNRSNKRYIVSKSIDGSQTYLGYYKTEEQAKLAVELYKKYGWSKENNWKVKYEVRKAFGEVD